MTYKRTVEKETYLQAEFCQTCQKPATVTFDERHGPRVRLCSRHYMDHVDSAGKGATSKKFNAAMKRERENQEILGHREYNAKAFDLLRSTIAAYGHR